jgi:hypothetical protein
MTAHLYSGDQKTGERSEALVSDEGRCALIQLV